VNQLSYGTSGSSTIEDGSHGGIIISDSEPGYHSVDMRSAGTETVIDGSTFLVKYRY